MIALKKKRLKEIEATQKVDLLSIDTAVDFIRMYPDRTHHGKEEDILFRYPGKRNLSEGDRRLMNGLIQAHVFGRRTTKDLVEANKLKPEGTD